MDSMEVLIIIWACVIAVALLVEFFTVDFSAICFATSGVILLILTVCNVPLVWQIPIYVVATILFIIFLRPLLKKTITRKTIPTNIDINFGKKVKLLADVVNGFSEVKLGDIMWTVVCDKALKKGDTVEIIKAEGNKLIVKGGE